MDKKQGHKATKAQSQQDDHTRIFTYSFCESFVDKLIEYIDEYYIKKGKDISRLAIVFGGKRPALFIKRELAKRIKTSFYSPAFFSIDEFIKYTLSKESEFSAAEDLDQCYLLYRLARNKTPHILKGRESFAQFLPWARETLAFVDQLDLENVSDDDLAHVQDNAGIGYPVPEEINNLLQSIVILRKAYHKEMTKTKMYSRGFQYKKAAEAIDKVDFEEFDQVFFCNFFYFNRTERVVIKTLYERNKARLFFQGDERKWPVLNRISKEFSCLIQEGAQPDAPQFNLKLYSGFDTHSQVGLVREILKGIKNLNNTVIVLPNADHIIPLLSEVTTLVKDFNISMGYPLRRSSLYSLFEFVFKAQLSRTDHGYYAKDYLKVLRHPFMKNLKVGEDSTATRILVHKIEEVLSGQEKTEISGSVFIDLIQLHESEDLYALTQDTLQGMGLQTTRKELQDILSQIHSIAFKQWEEINNFDQFANLLESFLELFVHKSFLRNYPLNLKIASKMLDIKDEIQAADFKLENFPQEDIFKIFDAKIEREIIAFHGSPLKGLQILGLFETRSLNFENVIVLDVNEGVLPRLNIYEPLIPREVMINLNLDRLELEEEIQRYQFMRLISSAKNVHLVYQESRDKEKSRFVEELIWEEQKKQQQLNVLEPVRPSFDVKVASIKNEVHKTPAILSFLKNHRYSASSINTYLRSPMEFYYNYVLGLREKEDLLDEPENRQVGTFIHELLEDVFKKFVGKKPVFDAKFKAYFQKMLDDRFVNTLGRSMKADAFLLKSVLDSRLTRFLEHEANSPERAIKEILFIEEKFEDKIILAGEEINFVYRVDRIDRLEDGSVMILDYKTGSVDPMPKGISRIESMDLSRESIMDNVKSFQIPLYFHYLDKYFKDQTINAAFYNLRTLEVHKFIDKRMTYDRPRINAAFLRALDYVVGEILNPDIPFSDEG